MRNPYFKLFVLLLSIALGCAIVTGIYGLRHAEGSLDARLARVADNMNKQLPLMADPETRLDRVTAGPGSQLTYAFSLPNKERAAIDLVTFEKSIRETTLSNYKTNSSMAEMRAAQVKLAYQYRDKNGAFITEILVTPKDF